MKKWRSKVKRGKGKKKDEPSSATRTNNMAASAAGPVTPGKGSLGLGTLRLGTMRSESSAPICTPTPGSRRQLISDLLESDTEGEGEDPSTVAASPALRSMISRKSSTGDTLKELSEEKVRDDSNRVWNYGYRCCRMELWKMKHSLEVHSCVGVVGERRETNCIGESDRVSGCSTWCVGYCEEPPTLYSDTGLFS